MAGMGHSGTGIAGGPKILLAKPTTPRTEGGAGGAGVVGVVKLMRDRDEDSSARVRLPHGSLNLLTDSWDFYPDRLLPLMSDNTDYMVVGVLGPPGVGKSTIMNELYGFDGTASGVLPSFSTQSEETKAGAKHCSVGIELRMSAERFILLDSQESIENSDKYAGRRLPCYLSISSERVEPLPVDMPVFSASVLMELMRSDGFSNISLHTGDTLSAELAHELIGLQVEMLKQGIPDPSTLPPAASGQSFALSTLEKDDSEMPAEELSECFSDVVFVHTKLHKQECSVPAIQRLERALSLFFPSPAFRRNKAVKYRPPQFPSDGPHFATGEVLGKERGGRRGENGVISLSGRTSRVPSFHGGASPISKDGEEKGGKSAADDSKQDTGVNFFILPLKVPDELTRHHHESYMTMLARLRNQVLSMPRRSFARPLTEREWLRNAARMWDLVKKSPVLAEYTKVMQASGLYRR